MESFTILTSSAMVDHAILHFTQQHFAKWLAIASEAQKCFYVISEFYSFLHQGWANFSVAKKSNFTENCVGRRQGSEFRGLQYLIKKLITFQGL